MDNSLTLPGYKYYLAPDGSRPGVYVAFLDVEPVPGAAVNGVCLPVDEAALAGLDARERQYERIDVTGQVTPAPGRVWTYAGRDESRRRFQAALAAGRCVAQRAYADLVEQGFRALGDGHWDRFESTLAGERPPVVELDRVDVP